MCFRAVNALKQKTRSKGAGPRKGTLGSGVNKHRLMSVPLILLVCGGLRLRSWLHGDEAPVAAPVHKLDMTSDERKKRVVLALTDVFAGLVLGAALAHQDCAGVDELTAEALDAQPLSV